MMKKLFLLLFVFILLSNTFSGKLCFQSLEIDEGATYAFYLLDTIELNMNGVSVIKNGNSSIVKTNFKKAKQIKENLSNVLGESVSFEGDMLKFSLIIEKLELKYSFSENVEDKIICFYGYSCLNELKSREVLINEKKVNGQIALNNNVITIGNPIILGDY